MSVDSSFLDSPSEPQNFNTNAPFDLLVSDLFLKLESTNHENKGPYETVSAKKTSIIEDFVKTWRTHFGKNIYPAVRLIFPNRDGRKYHVKDVALTRLVIKLLKLQPGSNDYQIIRNWKKQYQSKATLATASEQRQLGDLPLIIARIMSRRRDQNEPIKSTLTVDEVNETLDKLAAKTQSKEQLALLEPFVERLTIPEIRCVFQMILKESMLSFFERAFFQAWHPDAYNLFKVCEDMKKIFWALTDPEKRLLPTQLCVQPMYMFVPQSSQKLEISYENLCKRMTVGLQGGKDPKLMELYKKEHYENAFLIEEKIDGDRMLMHMVDGKFRWHTRRRRDYTLVYGENVHIGSLTKHLGHAFDEKVHSIVKDREMILPFGTLRSAAVQEALKQFDVIDVYEGNNSWPLFLVFDILHLNGRDLSGLPLFYRKNLINKVVREVPHRFEVLEWVKAKSPTDIKANMQRIVSERNEGIMVKSLLSKYRVYSRESTWIKVKPEYLENFGENLDLVVIGKIGRVKTSYICGLKDVDDEGCYKSFCMVANGFSNAVYRQIESKLVNYWRDFSIQKPPLSLLKFGTKKPDFWINPANSIVLEIKARSIEVTAETPYAAGSTLHNLWCRAVREDKDYDECITLQEYQDLKAKYSSDIYKNQDVNRNRKRPGENSIVEKYEKVKRLKIKEQSDLFKGLHLVVGTDYRDVDEQKNMSAEALKHLIRSHGGQIELNPKRDELYGKTVVVLGSNVTPRLQRWLREGFDIISGSWAVETIGQAYDEGQKIPLLLKETFLDACVDAGMVVDEDPYKV
ncbi:hypothetical protein CXQ85_001112 [Candidozyma haemuli]|uniref:DNA ligase 4 n=1 Tax=Candidozyma haemuli TaxID=45357 RepID=A0A2V1AM78_9ASCO|nr:hypothetical protein CXQ85_001112 [[Candida] haemuloni]PVH18822.1 hypothetical protein CXQ85_001112 [[Candida] haemuloni]